MTQSEISALKEKAKKATPGPWHLAYQTPFGAGGAVCSPRNIHARTKDWEEVEIVQQPHMDKRNHNQAWDNGRFIAAANPQAILALIEMNEKMREALEFYKGNFDGKEGSYWLDGYKFIQEDKFGDTKYFDNGDRARQTIALFDGEVKA